MKIPLPVIAIAGIAAIITVVAGVIIMLSSGPVVSPTSTQVTPQPPVTSTTPITTPTTVISPIPITSITVPTISPPTSTTFTITPSTPITVPTIPEEVHWITSFEELAGLVNYIKYKIETLKVGEEARLVMLYYDRGVEVIGNVKYRKVEFIHESNDTSSNITLWIPQQAGGAIKAVVNGVELPEPYAEYIAKTIIDTFMNFFVGPAAMAASINWPNTPESLGRLVHVSTTQIRYGNTVLMVDKWVFIPNPANSNFANVSKIDIWTSKFNKYYICVYLRIETKDFVDIYELLEMS